MTRAGIDVSNYSSPFTPEQLDYIRDNISFVIIGLQSAAKARAFKVQLQELAAVSVDLEYYVDKPGRDVSIADPGNRIWIDVEVGCFTSVSWVDNEIMLLQNEGLTPGIYCNRVSLQVLDAPPNPAWSTLPLWYADYRDPRLDSFVPFNGWGLPAIWQYSSNGVAGINCDLNVSYEELPVDPVPVPPEPAQPYVTYNKIGFSDGTEWYLEVKAPPQ